jgi:Domain of unknown function (DUF4296)
MIKIIIGLIFIAIFYSCNNSTPSGILSPKMMQALLTEQIMIDAFAKEFLAKDTSIKVEVENIKLQQKVFAKYNIDKETFYKSYDYYLMHNELFSPLLDSIIAKETRLQEKQRKEKAKQDSINISKHEQAI